ncbi:MAG: SDR family oxidoreductase [Alphaproteobacteria bacterium]|nr:SDR family oxidoreductase [Alphaproteobacteria bacterium]
MQLKDKVAIVTGAAGGIGTAICKRFAAEGASVVVSDVNDAGGKALVEALKKSGGRATYIRCDTSKPEDAQALVDGTVREFGKLNVVINNAGVLRMADLLECTVEDFDLCYQVNVRGVFLVAQAAARAMVKNGWQGAFVNLASLAAEMVQPMQLAYGASKAAVRLMTKAMAVGLADKGIRVNAIGPGTVATDMGYAVFNDPKYRREILARTPLGRMGTPEEMAAIILFLASDESSYITGQTVFADGGRMGLNYTLPIRE